MTSRSASGDRAPLQFGVQEFGLFALVVFAWGFSWYAIHCQLGDVPPVVSILWRFILAGAMMFIWAFVRGDNLRYGLGDHIRLAIVGACLFCCNFIIFYNASYYMASGLVAVVFSLSTVINMILGAVFLRVPIERRVALGGIVGTLGVAVLFWPQIMQTTLGTITFIGLGLSVLGTTLFCSGNMFSMVVQRRGLPLIGATAWSMFYGCIILFCICLVMRLPFRIDLTFNYLWALLYLAVIASVIGFSAYLGLLRRVGASTASYSTVLSPILALTASTFLEDYRWTLVSLCGAVLAVIGNIIILHKPRARSV
jgi:Permeases of the drug/metabolite transporter (DMT) superfamily